MSALGQKQTYAVQKGMSALPLKADIQEQLANVRFVPIADMARALSIARAHPTYRTPHPY
jgi:hypothetical protein